LRDRIIAPFAFCVGARPDRFCAARGSALARRFQFGTTLAFECCAFSFFLFALELGFPIEFGAAALFGAPLQHALTFSLNLALFRAFGLAALLCDPTRFGFCDTAGLFGFAATAFGGEAFFLGAFGCALAEVAFARQAAVALISGLFGIDFAFAYLGRGKLALQARDHLFGVALTRGT